jgi:hypothetical protein
MIKMSWATKARKRIDAAGNVAKANLTLLNEAVHRELDRVIKVFEDHKPSEEKE